MAVPRLQTFANESLGGNLSFHGIAVRVDVVGWVVCRLVELNPSALDVTSFMALVKDAKRVLPALSITKVLNTDPTFVNQFQKGKEMIPYDD